MTSRSIQLSFFVLYLFPFQGKSLHSHNSHNLSEIDHHVPFASAHLTKFSSHHCIGGHDYDSSRAAGDRACVFHNICHKKGEHDVLYYYVDPNLPRPAITADHNTFQYEFNPRFLSVGVYPQDKFVTDKWSPTIVDGEIPPHFEYEANVSRYIYFESYCEANPGELINLMHAIYASPLVHGYEPSTDIKLIDYGNTKRRTKHRNEIIMKGLTIHQPQYLREMGDVCFKTFFAGTGFMSILFGDHMIATTADRMKKYVLHNLGYPLPPPPTKKHNILVLLKSNSQVSPAADSGGMHNKENHIINLEEIKTFLHTTFDDVADVVFLMPDDLPWAEQIYIIQSASVIITAPGGGSFATFFARTGTSVIYFDQLWMEADSVRFAGSGSLLGMDDQWFTHMHSIKTFHYPVCVEREFVPPGNFNLVPKRLQHVVVLALIHAELTFTAINMTSVIATKSIGRMPKMCEIM